MKKGLNTVKKILDHPDREEVISKIILDISFKDIHEWLKAKYSSINEKKFVLSESSLKNFKDNYLDVYNLINEDIAKTKASIANPEYEIDLAIRNNPTYKGKMMELANKEIDIRQMIRNLCVAIETRLGQVFDEIQADPRTINTKIDRLLIEYGELFGNLLERYYKFTENPADIVINNNVTVQLVDQHISVFHDVIKEVLAQMDLESSMLFMSLFSEKMAKLKMPTQEIMNTDAKLAEAKILQETIDKRLNA